CSSDLVDAGVGAEVRGGAEAAAGGAEGAGLTGDVAFAAVERVVREVRADARAEVFARQALVSGGASRTGSTGICTGCSCNDGGVAGNDGIEVHFAAARDGAEGDHEQCERQRPVTPHGDTSR